MEKVFIKDKHGNKVLPITHVSAVLDDEGNDLGSHLGTFEDEVRGLVDTPHQEYVTVSTYASLPASGSEDTIYRVSNYDGSQSQVAANVYSEYAWDGTQYVFLCVKSQVGEVFDISAYHNNATYADLNAALTGNTGGVPSSLQKGGMSVKFVCSSDNKYIRCNLLSSSFTTDVTKWAIDDVGIYVENPEWIKVVTDSEGKILYGIKADGNFYFGAGCPPQVQEYVQKQIEAIGIDALLATKVDKVPGKSLIDADYASSQEVVENPEWLQVITDSVGNILEGTKRDGSKYIYKLNGLDEKIFESIKEKVILDYVKNGGETTLGGIKDFTSYGMLCTPTISPNNIDSLHCTCETDGVKWCYFGPFNPEDNKFFHVKFNAVYANNSINASIIVANGYTGNSDNYFVGYTNPGENDLIIDPTYYRVHRGFSNQFYIWILARQVQDRVLDIYFEELKVYDPDDNYVSFNNIEGNNAKELFQSVDTELSDINKDKDATEYLVSPNGNKYVLEVNNSGVLSARSVIPTKAAFFGNSIMFGNAATGVGDFGMCASERSKDFYALFNSYCLTLNPNYTAAKYSAVPFETISDLASIDSVVANTVANLSGDEDFVGIVAGGNVSAEHSIDILPTSSLRLVHAVREKCPNARVFWMASWYPTPEKMDAIRNACSRYGATLVDIGYLNTPENQATIGDLIDFGAASTDEWTLDNVSNFVDNGNNNITVTFTYNGVTATTTLDVSTFSLDNTTLTYSGRYRIVTLQYAHPGDNGMKALANKLLYASGISDSENQY